MELVEINANIESFEADALVYSTNQYLHLSGGVGQALVKKYGVEVQNILDRYLRVKNIDEVEVGTIVESVSDNMPWKRVFHTVATDKEYETQKSVVEKIIRYVLETCEVDFSISSVAFSALGSGFGSLTYEEFMKIMRRELVRYQLSSAFKVYVVNKI
ncbi:macro domain-containing protein [Gynuella sunshinyii]|uniref:Putative phosphatase, C-terminal domain of histone macroH2A1-like protein n=1 Tax=Gynuella sunshinyii YC6258 TaxID=1445510 RepID=A0A0C5VZB2_9GAMM|nr:macro domain-containing protein [Gynuella sunshinyii]AJQ95739.1 putative phosphatase, C-terminal domain of histone macroH2A1-like protein [Gynuella sunshinyii YC6258]